MYKIKTYNKISKSGLEVFDEKYTIGDEVENAEGNMTGCISTFCYIAIHKDI